MDVALDDLLGRLWGRVRRVRHRNHSGPVYVNCGSIKRVAARWDIAVRDDLRVLDDLLVHNARLINDGCRIVDLRAINDGHVIVIHVLPDGPHDVHITSVIRLVNFSRAKRKPSHPSAALITAEKCHERGAKTLSDCRRSRSPGPAHPPDVGPASVVVRRPPPGLIGNPGPAEGVDPDPAAQAIGLPVSSHSRHPNGPVRPGLDPPSVTAHALVTVHTGWDILRARRIESQAVPSPVPAVPIIALEFPADGEFGGVIRNVEPGRSPKVFFPAVGNAGRSPASVQRELRIPIRAHVNSIFAGVLYGEGKVRSIDLVVAVQPLEPERRGTRGHLELKSVVIALQQTDIALCADS